MKKALGFIIAALVLIVLLFVTGTLYTVKEGQQIILTQFGKPIGEPITDAGLHVKWPFIVKINVVEKRVLAWDGKSVAMPTRDKTYIQVDTFARWRIADPLLYFKTLRDERSALSRLDDILGSVTLNAVAKHDLLEVVRSTKDRKPERTDLLTEKEADFEPIKIGRREIEKNLNEIAKAELENIGIELLDLRFKRINYNQKNDKSTQMISERQKIAERFRSEGAAKRRGRWANGEGSEADRIRSLSQNSVNSWRSGCRIDPDLRRSLWRNSRAGELLRVCENIRSLRQNTRQKHNRHPLDCSSSSSY